MRHLVPFHIARENHKYDNTTTSTHGWSFILMGGASFSPSRHRCTSEAIGTAPACCKVAKIQVYDFSAPSSYVPPPGLRLEKTNSLQDNKAAFNTTKEA